MNAKHRQKVLMVLILVTFVIMLIQVYSTYLTHDYVIAAPSSAIINLNPPLKPAQRISHISTAKADPRFSEAQLIQNSKFQGYETEQKNQYLALLHQYQIAQVQRLLAQENAAIAQAHRTAAQAQFEAAKYVADSTDSTGAPRSFNDNVIVSTQYQVKFVELRGASWHAIVSRNGRLVELQVGDKLDGMSVTTIDHTGLTLKNDRKLQRILFSGDLD